jgi:hypothetical protein
MIGIDGQGRGVQAPGMGNILGDIQSVFSNASDREIRAFVGKFLRGLGLTPDRAARVVGINRSQHFEDMRIAPVFPVPAPASAGGADRDMIDDR